MLKQENSNMAELDEYFVTTDNIAFSMDSVNLEDLGHLGTFNSQGNLVVLSPRDSEETLDINYALPVPSVEEMIPGGDYEPLNKLEIYKNGPYYRAIKIYNKIPSHIKTEQTDSAFKTKLKNILIENCYYSVPDFMEDIHKKALYIPRRELWCCLPQTYPASLRSAVYMSSAGNPLLPGLCSNVSPRGPPARTAFPGGLNFTVEINAADTNRKKYLYSHQLNRIYVDIKTNFPVQFRWDFDRAASPMFVRATTVFSDGAQSEKRVERCLQHTHESANAAIDPVIVKNVLHSSAAPGTQGVVYCGAPGLPDSWYSVLLRCDGRPQDMFSHAYQFVCKNSCSSGINRRSIDIIFTLEDHTGQVYGRQTVGARVCACPRRDKLKDEETEPRANKRRAAPPPPPPPHHASKKVKVEVDDDVLVLPPLPIVGRRTMITGLEVMLNMMEAVAAKTAEHETDRYQISIHALRDKIEELRGSQAE